MATLSIPRARLKAELDAVYAEALAQLEAQVAARPSDKTLSRWVGALSRAWLWIEAQETLVFTDLHTDHPGLLVPSTSEPGKTYTANGSCGCTAHIKGQPCQHRAASKLARKALARAMDAALAAETPEQTQARLRAVEAARSTAEMVLRIRAINEERNHAGHLRAAV